MKILLTGLSGFFGPWVARELVREGHEVVLFGRKPPAEEFSRLEFIQGDVNDMRDCLAAAKGRKIDAVAHIAAKPQPTDSPKYFPGKWKDPDFFPQTMQTNVMGVYNMLQAVVRSDIGIFVLTGSNCALGHVNRISGRPFPLRYLPVDEYHPSDVEDTYSLSKLIDDQMLSAYSRAYGLRAHSIRSGWIFDEAMRRNWAKKVAPANDLFQYFNPYVNAEEEAEVTRLVLEKAKDLPLYGEYYCNSDDSLALEPTMELIEKFQPEILPYLKASLPGNSAFISNKKLKEATGWKPSITWREYLQTKA